MPFLNADGLVVSPVEFELTDVSAADLVDATYSGVVGLTFDNTGDGRAFSACALIRANGFQGTIVGLGCIGVDRLTLGFRVGFDLLWVDDDEAKSVKPQHLRPVAQYYQPSNTSRQRRLS